MAEYKPFPADVGPHPRPCLCGECRAAIAAFLRVQGAKTIVFTPNTNLKTLVSK
jgi:hypothetical protein